MPIRRLSTVALSLVLSVALPLVATVGCGDGGDDAAPSDPVLAQGQQVYRQNCASCHGAKGGGGAGPKLAGVVAANLPNIDDHIAVIAQGRGNGRMPAFEGRLTPEEIESVARWEREGF